MRTIRTPPFARPNPACFEPSQWRVLQGRALGDGDLIKEWDASLTLKCSREIEVDLGLLTRSGRLKPGAYVAFVPTWWSDGTGLRGCGDVAFIQLGASGGRQLFTLELAIPGVEVAGNLQLKSSLVLSTATPVMAGDRLAPRREGSILWEDTISISLEGDAPRFPISVVDFVENALGPANACWRFDWSPAEPSLPAMATMRLLVNSRQAEFRQALVSLAPTEAQSAVRSALKHALAVELLNLAIAQASELEVGMPYEVGSSGRVLVDLISRLLPGHTPLSCAELHRTDPGRFSAEVQSRIGLFSVSIFSGGEA